MYNMVGHAQLGEAQKGAAQVCGAKMGTLKSECGENGCAFK
jgi:hypothetical protein